MYTGIVDYTTEHNYKKHKCYINTSSNGQARKYLSFPRLHFSVFGLHARRAD